MDFIKKHKVLFIVIGVVLAIFIVMCCIRAVNLSKKANEPAPEVSQTVPETPIEEEEQETEQSDYQSSLSIKAKEEESRKEEAEKRLAEKRAEEERKKQEEEAKKAAEAAEPTYGDDVKIWSSDGVPEIMEDGRSIKQYLAEVSLADFGSKWGSALNNEDKLTEDFYMVGVDQNPDDYVKGVQNQSFGWLIDNLNGLPKNGAIKFTDLNVVGSLASDHVALLCCYNWYSVWGLKETMMVFEDISGTLKPADFKPGDIFSAIAYVHNIKVEKVNGQTVICVQYNTFK